MKTSHLTAIKTTLNPFSAHSKVPRLVLALLGPSAQKSLQIKTTQLPRHSTLPARLELAFKDGKTMKWEWQCKPNSSSKTFSSEGELGLEDVVQEVERHTRLLARKEELSS